MSKVGPGRPPEHSRFKPGQSGNPKGKPAGLLTADKVKSVMGKFHDMTREDLQAVVTNPKSTMLEIMVASIMAKAAKEGDASRFGFLLDRQIGRVPTETNVTIEQAMPLTEVERATLKKLAEPE